MMHEITVRKSYITGFWFCGSPFGFVRVAEADAPTKRDAQRLACILLIAQALGARP